MSRAISNCKDTTFFETGKIYFLMSSTKSLWQQLLHDIQVELTEEFDRNFERKAFFDRPWRPRRSERSGRGSLLNVTGKLRRSILPEENSTNGTVTWTSSEPYADIQNNGGTITVTKAMKAHAWKEYYKLVPHIQYTRSGALSHRKQNLAIAAEAEMWKAIALMKPGSKIEIPQRQFIGDHPQVRESIAKVFSDNADELANTVSEILKKHIK